MADDDWQVLREFEVVDEALPLRRFMDASKFRHLMDTGTLYFAPSSAFEDKLEGHYTSRDYEAWDRQLVDWGFDSRGREMASSAKAAIARHNQGAVVISCWTTACASNARLWDEYARSPEAVVVETTVGRLRDALGGGFLIVPVRYVDFAVHQIPKDHSLQAFCYKQHDYQWEQEVRVIGEMELGKRIGSPREAPVVLNTLIEKIGLHSEAPLSLVHAVFEVLRLRAPTAGCETLCIRNT